MSDTPSDSAGKSIMPSWIKCPQDFVGGLVLCAVAIFALWASSDLQGMHGFSFGAGTAPRMFAVLLLGLGAAVAVVGAITEGPGIAHYSWRGPLFVMAGIVFFGLAIRPLGLILSGGGTFLVSSVGAA